MKMRPTNDGGGYASYESSTIIEARRHAATTSKLMAKRCAWNHEYAFNRADLQRDARGPNRIQKRYRGLFVSLSRIVKA